MVTCVYVNETKAMVKFQLKKVLCMGVAVGNVVMDEKQIFQNVQMSVNFLVSLLKKNWRKVSFLFVEKTLTRLMVKYKNRKILMMAKSLWSKQENYRRIFTRAQIHVGSQGIDDLTKDTSCPIARKIYENDPFFALRTLYSQGSKFGWSCKGEICGALLDGSIIRKFRTNTSPFLNYCIHDFLLEEIFGALIAIGVGLDNPTHALAGQVVPIAVHSNQVAISWLALYPLANFDLC
ncbi:hypothetical protein GQ457_02G033780 [Hibiscus cannabinus]